MLVLWSPSQHSILQEFGEYPIDNISCPVIAIKGTEDDLLGGQEDEWFARLSPATQEKSVLIEYGPDSGGALHCQVGAPNALSAKMFAALNPILQVGSQEPFLLFGIPQTQGTLIEDRKPQSRHKLAGLQGF